DFCEIASRVAQFGADESLWLTRAATFVDKARAFPGVTFVVGLDTIRRIGEPRYYGSSPQVRDRAIDDLTEAGCRFLVFGRREGDRFLKISDAALPPALAKLCAEVPEQRFRVDLSSTELRQQGTELPLE